MRRGTLHCGLGRVALGSGHDPQMRPKRTLQTSLINQTTKQFCKRNFRFFLPSIAMTGEKLKMPFLTQKDEAERNRHKQLRNTLCFFRVPQFCLLYPEIKATEVK